MYAGQRPGPGIPAVYGTGPRPDTDRMTAAPTEISAYGDHVVAVEPTGAEPVPEQARHGRPIGLLWTWTSPNMEFATVFVGVLAVGVFGLGFWPAVLAILLGTGLGALAHAFLGLSGPRFGVPQMAAGRSAFGYLGNALPAGLNALTAGIGWFAVNSVSATYALSTLLGWHPLPCLFIVVVLQCVLAYFGHNFIHTAEKYAFPVLTVIFLITAVVLLSKAHLGAADGSAAAPGAFLLTVGASFGYAAGWTPYGSDYTRYLPKATPKWAVALWPALGVFLSCVALEIVGAASVTAISPKLFGSLSANPTAAFTYALPSWLAKLTLLAITIGGIAANALNIYSGSLSFLATGIKLPRMLRRAGVSVVFGVAGTLLAWSGLSDSGAKYENFLLVITYWIGPWLAITFVDRYLRRDQPDAEIAALLADPAHRNWAAPIAMALGTTLGVWLFSNQTEYVGLVAKHLPGIGDSAFEAGFLITALLYLALRPIPALSSAKVAPEPATT